MTRLSGGLHVLVPYQDKVWRSCWRSPSLSAKYFFLALSIAVRLNLRECLVAYCILVNTAWETFACGDIKVTYNAALARHDTRAPTLLQINFVSLSKTACLTHFASDCILLIY